MDAGWLGPATLKALDVTTAKAQPAHSPASIFQLSLVLTAAAAAAEVDEYSLGCSHDGVILSC